MKKILLIILLSVFYVILPLKASARDTSTITDWYIKDFNSQIIINKDSSLSITETIQADCGNLPDKHGIFRTLPTFYQKTASEKVSTPITLQSITNTAGTPIKYSTTNDQINKTVTWKIGDPNITVHGINTYVIKYLVKNTIRFDNPNFDEFYWNLNGNYWQIDTDHYSTNIIFPSEINQDSVKEINLYSGNVKDSNNKYAQYSWSSQNTLHIESTAPLDAGVGITASVTFPKNIITPYKPTFWEKYGQILWLLIPLMVFLICFNIWRKFGRDFKLNRPIIAEYDIPDNLSPLEFGTLWKNGVLNSKFISASIINLAVKGHIKIEQLPKTGLFGKDDFLLTKLKTDTTDLTDSEKDLLDDLFLSLETIRLSELKNSFYKNVSTLQKTSLSFLEERDYFDKNAFKYRGIMLGIGGTVFVISYIISKSFSDVDFAFWLSVFASAVIIIVFAFLMPRRTQKGAETLWKIEGFKLFISVTEKYRQQFNEKENIFEKFLPYAMIFGLTSVWINNMKKIYGEDYFNTYHPYWFYGPSFTNFDAESFNSMISNLSDNMASTIASNPSGSGSGGGGFSGGGGGGGGGGGW